MFRIWNRIGLAPLDPIRNGNAEQDPDCIFYSWDCKQHLFDDLTWGTRKLIPNNKKHLISSHTKWLLYLQLVLFHDILPTKSIFFMSKSNFLWRQSLTRIRIRISIGLTSWIRIRICIEEKSWIWICIACGYTSMWHKLEMTTTDNYIMQPHQIEQCCGSVDQ